MELKDSFYIIDQYMDEEAGFAYVIHLNKEHIIYQAHFPKMKVTPGACILQIAIELLQEKLNMTMDLAKIVNLKFVNMLSPDEHSEGILVRFTKLTHLDNNYKVQVTIEKSAMVFAKMSLLFTVPTSL